jgi:hypothetical protein
MRMFVFCFGDVEKDRASIGIKGCRKAISLVDYLTSLLVVLLDIHPPDR